MGVLRSVFKQIGLVLLFYIAYIAFEILGYFLIGNFLTDSELFLMTFQIFYRSFWIFVLFYFLFRQSKSIFHVVSIADIVKFLSIIVVFRIAIDPIFRFNDILYGFSHDILKLYESPTFEMITFLTFVSTVILTPIIEEFIFRGYLINKLNQIEIENSTIIILSSFLFAIIHVSIIQIVITFLLGIILSFIYFNNGLLGSILVHVFYNFVWFVFDYYRNYYWDWVEFLNFGYEYWLIILVSILLVGLLLLKIGQKQYPNEE